MATNPLAAPSALKDVINPQFHQNNFPAEFFAKTNLGLKLDKGRTSSSLVNPPTHPRERERLSTVCKHWLRGLCKKGDACEFLHEYNLRRMPECWWFAKYGYCSAGDECLYAHPKERRIECPDYNRGFCKLGPSCPRKHNVPVAILSRALRQPKTMKSRRLPRIVKLDLRLQDTADMITVPGAKPRLCRVHHDATLTKCCVSSAVKEDIMLITAEIEMFQAGMLFLFIQHTSAALTVNENFDSGEDLDCALMPEFLMRSLLQT
ncbi:hypothetical protein H1R20_g8246, partial [Candolleomyces eurysporus]